MNHGNDAPHSADVLPMRKRGNAHLVDLDLEAQILGAVIGDAARWPEVSFLKEDHFTDAAHRRVWKAFEDIAERGQKISAASVAHALGGDLAELGGRKFLSGLAAVGHLVSQAAGDMADQLRQAAQWRQMAVLQKNIQTMIERHEVAPEEALSKVIQLAQESLVAGRTNARTKRDVARTAIQDALADRPLVTTGITDLDYLMQGGLIPRRLYGMGGLFGRGKTIMLGSISENLNADGVPHAFISLETPPEDIEIRNCARALDLNASQIFDTGDPLHKRFTTNAERYVDNMADHTVYEYIPGATYYDVQRAILQAKHRHGIKGFILDYWQLVRGREKGQSEAGHLRNVVDLLAALCRRENLWGIVAAQADQYGVPTLCQEGMFTACALYICLKRDENGSVAWFETMKSNYTRYADTGHAGSPNMVFDQAGPHFRDAAAADISQIQHDAEELPH